ncbi:MAG TPA: hypothetical protein VH333_17995 [Pseudonocardiaceae bacterium]|jgi:hypothetical protein|nr:hypothetical protein [Pseudonocardiaceae bacterium]
MDENEIEDGLREICIAEPALGFDPDDVATRAARRLRNRRSTLGASVGTLAVVGVAATALAIVPHMSSAAHRGGQSSYATTGTTPRPLDMTAQMARVLQHLLATLPGLLPGASHLTVTMTQDTDTGDGDGITAEVAYRDAGGPATFNLTITGKLDRSAVPPPPDRCTATTLFDTSSPYQCLPQADGSNVYVEVELPFTRMPATTPPVHTGPADILGYAVFAYRLDGSVVSVLDSRSVGAALASRLGSPEMTVRAQPPLGQQQVLALVTDPQLNLAPGH